MNIPKDIQRLLAGKASIQDTIGQSDSAVFLYDDAVLKIEKMGENAENELRMLQWLDGKLPVPKILCVERWEEYQYLLMSRLQGEMLCAPGLMECPQKLLHIIAEGIRLLWTVPIEGCPYHNAIDNKLRLAEKAVRNGLVDVENTEPGTWEEFGTPENLLAWLKENKPQTEELVFSHGDLCLPNLFCENEHISGFLDLGNAGIADKWQDLALIWRSLNHNYCGKYANHKINVDFNADALFSVLGIEPNWEKLRYFILLDELF